MKYLVIVVMACSMFLGGCGETPENDSTPDTTQDTTQQGAQDNQTSTVTPPSTVEIPVQSIDGYWKSECEPMFPIAAGDDTAYKVLYFSFALDSSTNMLTKNSVEEVYADDQCTMPFEGAWPNQTETLPETSTINVNNFVYYNYFFNSSFYLVGSPLATTTGDYAMEITFLLGGATISNQYSSIFTFGQYYLYKNIFSLTDNGNTLLFGANHEELFYNCLQTNSDYLAGSYRYLNYSSYGYNGLTVWDLDNISVYQDDVVDPVYGSAVLSTSYSFDSPPDFANITSEIPLLFLNAYPFPYLCVRPQTLDYERRFIRIDRPDWWPY